MIPKGQSQRVQISQNVFVEVRSESIPAMDAQKVDYNAITIRIVDSKGTQLDPKVYCSCTSGGCSKSGTCSNGNINCDCISCTFSCS